MDELVAKTFYFNIFVQTFSSQIFLKKKKSLVDSFSNNNKQERKMSINISIVLILLQKDFLNKL
jgi:hypothetical protein